jgi:anti-sigma factor RsiW
MMVSVPRAINKCPNCREPVSPFAAGCAICGTSLEAARAELAAKRARRPSLPGSIRLGDDAVRIGVGVIAAVFSPVMGSLLTGYFAYDADRNGRTATRNLMIALLGLSLVGVFAYAQLWGGLIIGL